MYYACAKTWLKYGGVSMIPWAIHIPKYQACNVNSFRDIMKNVLRMRKDMAEIWRCFDDPMGHPYTQDPNPHKHSITGWQVTLSAFLLLVPELFEKKKFVLLSRFNQDALENYFSQVRRMTILLQWTSCTRTRMLLAELMFAMCGNANYEPDDNIILESTQIIPQTDEDCLDLVIDEPSWIAQKHRKIGMIWSSTVPLMWQAAFQKNSSENLL
ncbi:hypothetical protein AVEN_205506-1 [Araneus ventricosus]|uniref:Uncharacterized protein n=1 Tax=Araneus ventricosus TaxID=182803 RepID=A0A4Y2S1V5_ARAVE|nr:hypothetical protein AVEN_205506-1 [Araneus ventricosus]